MVGDNSYQVLGPLEVLAPFFKCKDDHQKLMIIDIVIMLGRGKGSGKICTWVEILVGIRLEEDGACCEEGSVGHDGKQA